VVSTFAVRVRMPVVVVRGMTGAPFVTRLVVVMVVVVMIVVVMWRIAMRVRMPMVVTLRVRGGERFLAATERVETDTDLKRGHRAAFHRLGIESPAADGQRPHLRDDMIERNTERHESSEQHVA
jgi:hypothetical protein